MTERHEPDPRHEDALERALHAHAESVRPAGDGLVRIRARVERRRALRRFLVPAGSVATVAAAAAVIVASGVLAGPSRPSTSALGDTSSSVPAPATHTVIRKRPMAPAVTRTAPVVAPTVTAASVASSVPTPSAARTSTVAPAASTTAPAPNTLPSDAGYGTAVTQPGLHPAIGKNDATGASASASAGPSAAASSAATGDKMPAGDLVAVSDHSLGLYDVTGALVKNFGTVAQPGLAVSGGIVYFSGPAASLSHGGCGAFRLDEALFAGGAGGLLPTEPGNQALPAGGGGTLAWLSTTCDADGSNEQQSIRWQSADAKGAITGFSNSPVPETLAVSPDGTQLVSFIRTGTQGELLTFDLATAKTLADGTAVSGCADPGAECIAGAYESNGDLVYVTTDGQKFTVYRVVRSTDALTPQKLFSVSASGQQATLSVNASGGVLVTDATSKGWSWQPGAATAKPLPFPVTDAAW